MEKIKREDFETWVKDCNWFKINETANPNGPQHQYLTPNGEVVNAQYNLNGELQNIGWPPKIVITARIQGTPLPIDIDPRKPFPGGLSK